IAEYARSAANPDLADTTEKGRLVIARKDFANESGGMLAFGSDGYLYAAVGTEPTLLTPAGGTLAGPGGNPVHGSIIRLDVSAGIAYGPGGGSYPSPVWANGLRQPWRFSFDRTTNDMYIGDVGDNTREEIDYEAFAGRVGGRYYGYSTFEGSYCAGVTGGTFNAACTAAAPSVVFPIYDYPHASGDGSVIGGYVYRGQKIPCLAGTYLFGDYLTSIVRAFVVANGAVSGTPQMVPGVSYVGKTAALSGLTSFGQDNTGELYLVHAPESGSAAIYRIDPK
ncbi:MAG TPA: PQQ-dependent sugar dehydrogenase, partial [Polyangia bacterium]|nr:PQQ-dependent sugar dehydrogenase [Polyangia bacterium]